MHPKTHIGLIGPSWRQTKLNIHRMADLLEKVPEGLYFRPHRTSIHFRNGSTIQAYPNNPGTVRGPSLDIVFWDEASFTPNDTELYDALLFTLGTTDGKLVCTSTPWSTDSLFWKMCNHRDFEDFARHHVTWEQAQEPNGPLKKGILERIRKQFGEDPARWRREMEAEWAEDENAWLPQSLIVACVGTVKNCGEDLQPWNPEVGYQGELFAGLDLAQVRDYCVFSVVERLNDRLFLRHLKVFSQPTKYANVLGYVKVLQDRWGGFEKVRVDFTKEGPSIISDMEDAGIKNAEGVTFSVPRKSEMASLLKQRMGDQKLFYPLLTWEKPYKGDICSELNLERYELRKDGAQAFSHPSGTHDDVFWSIALGVYATVAMKTFDLEAIRFG
jgi:phage FluMu gp28-like protein